MHQHTLAVSACCFVSFEKINKDRREVRMYKIGILHPWKCWTAPLEGTCYEMFAFRRAWFGRWNCRCVQILRWARFVGRYRSANVSWSYLKVPNNDCSASIVHGGRCNTCTPLEAMSCRISWYFSWFNILSFDPPRCCYDFVVTSTMVQRHLLMLSA